MDSASSSAGSSRSAEYVVVARRYRPQTFTDLIGQEQVSQALSKAIESHRVGHAYLFTGARGVGKTSTARILAKALNCEHGPTPTPCNTCDICQSVTAGEDVDVLEIDGASARGIDEIRQLRSNVNVRPSRARFKVYIIDEVHMFTREAFNALLKTLEEPPEHVKFIFCTTDPEKIPITVLSRCQRFDFPPVQTASIAERLRTICVAEGVTAEPEALQLLARRAAGSMRDSQSLLEQLLSFCEGQITAADVHRMLGTARGGSLAQLAGELADRRAAGALRALEAAIHEGVDVGQLAEQLLAYFRDVLAAAVGCSHDLLLQALPDDLPQLRDMGQRLGVETLLAIIQVLDQAITRMRQSPHVRTLLEVALVRITQLEDLDELSRLVGQLRTGTAPAGGVTSSASRPAPVASGTPTGEKKTAERTELGGEQAPATSLGAASSGSVPPTAVANTPTPSAAPSATHSAVASSSAVSGQPTPRPADPPSGASTSLSPAAPIASRPVTPAVLAPVAQPAPTRLATAVANVNDALAEAAAGANDVEPWGGELREAFAEPAAHSSGSQSNENRQPAGSALAVDDAQASPPSAVEDQATVDEVVSANPVTTDSPAPRVELNSANAAAIWQKVLDRLAEVEDMTADFASKFSAVRTAGPGKMIVEFQAGYNKNYCERPERFQRLQQHLAAELGRPVQLEFTLSSRAAAAAAEPKQPAVNRRQLWRELEKHPMVNQAKQMFDAEVVDVQEPRRTERASDA